MTSRGPQEASHALANVEKKQLGARRADLESMSKPQAASQTGSTDKLLTRAPAAEVIGVSESTFRRRIENVELTPIKDGGVHRFAESEVLEVALRYRRDRQRGAAHQNGSDDRGKLAAKLFTAFDDGVSSVDAVKRFELDPAIVEALHVQWARMRGAFVVTPDDARALETVTPQRERAPRSVKELTVWAQNLARRLDSLSATASATCKKCHRGPREICATCYRDNLEAEKTRRLEIAEQAKADRAYFQQLLPNGAPRQSHAFHDPSTVDKPSTTSSRVSSRGSKEPSLELPPEWFDPNWIPPKE